MSITNSISDSVNGVVVLSNTAGISPSMNGMTALVCYLMLFVFVVFSLQLLIKGLLELSVELIIVTPARVSNSLFKCINKSYKATINLIKKALEERKRVINKGKAKAEEIRKYAKIAKAKEAAAKRAEAAQSAKAKSDDAICRTATQAVKKEKTPDLSVPAYIRAGIELGKIFLDDKDSSSEPVSSSVKVKSRQQMRADFLKEKEVSKKLQQLQANRFLSSGLVEN